MGRTVKRIWQKLLEIRVVCQNLGGHFSWLNSGTIVSLWPDLSMWNYSHEPPCRTILCISPYSQAFQRCGRCSEVMLRYFAVKEVHAFDLDQDLVERARRRLHQYTPDKLLLTVGDATSIQEPDGSFDLAIETAVLHHVEDWRSAVREIRRVLRPGGFFYFEEVTRKGLQGWFNRTFLEHPEEDRFSTGEFISELEKNGIRVGSNFRERLRGGYFMGGGILIENCP